MTTTTSAKPAVDTVDISVPITFKRQSFAQRIIKNRISYIMLLPFLIPFLAFVILPIGASAYLSMTQFKGITAPVFNGIDNFRQLLSLEIKNLPQQTDATTGEGLYRCGSKRVPQSQVAAEQANGATCDVLMARPATILTSGYSEVTRITFLGKTYIIGGTDNRFWIAIKNTFTYALLVVPLGILIGLGLALALQNQSRLNYVLRTIFFLPSVTSTLAVVVVWTYIFNTQEYGLVNGIITRFGGKAITFLANEYWTMPIMVMLALWGGVGYNMILFLAGLQNISADLYEASAIDGATKVQNLIRITIPLLRPTLIYILITGTIGALQVFESVYILFSNVESVGGVLDSGLTVVPYLYDSGFRHFQLGYASAVAMMLFVIIFIITIINLRVTGANQPV